MASMTEVFSGYHKRLSALKSISDNPLSNGVAWVEGEICPLSQARIPLLDQGFLRSDLTYDVPSVWDGRFFRLDDHISRLEESCKKIRLVLPLSRETIKQILFDMVRRSDIQDAFVEIIVTRGFRFVRGALPEELLNNNIYMFVQPYTWVMEPAIQPIGGKAILARTVKRISPGSIDPTVKNLQWGDFIRGLFEARDRDATYPFLTDGDVNLTEGSGFNIFIVKDGRLYTPDRGVLEGVTRRTAIEAAHALSLDVSVQVVPVEMSYQADEIFMSTTAGGIMPITTLDGNPVGDGNVGPITRSIWDKYWAMHYDPRYSTVVDYSKPRL